MGEDVAEAGTYEVDVIRSKGRHKRNYSQVERNNQLMETLILYQFRSIRVKAKRKPQVIHTQKGQMRVTEKETPKMV